MAPPEKKQRASLLRSAFVRSQARLALRSSQREKLDALCTMYQQEARNKGALRRDLVHLEKEIKGLERTFFKRPVFDFDGLFQENVMKTARRKQRSDASRKRQKKEFLGMKEDGTKISSRFTRYDFYDRTFAGVKSYDPSLDRNGYRYYKGSPDCFECGERCFRGEEVHCVKCWKTRHYACYYGESDDDEFDAINGGEPKLSKRTWACDDCKRPKESNWACFVCKSRFLPKTERQIECMQCKGFFHEECAKNPPPPDAEGQWVCSDCRQESQDVGSQEIGPCASAGEAATPEVFEEDDGSWYNSEEESYDESESADSSDSDDDGNDDAWTSLLGMRTRKRKKPRKKPLSCANCGSSRGREYLDGEGTKCSVCKEIYRCKRCHDFNQDDHDSDDDFSTHVLPAMKKGLWTCDGCKRDKESNLGCFVCGTRFLLQGDSQLECRRCHELFHAECVKNPPPQGREKKWLCPGCGYKGCDGYESPESEAVSTFTFKCLGCPVTVTQYCPKGVKSAPFELPLLCGRCVKAGKSGSIQGGSNLASGTDSFES